MIEALKSFFARKAVPESSAHGAADGGGADQKLRVAACALLLEIAYADDVFTPEERAHLEDSVMRHFGLDVATAGELIAFADEERKAALDLFQFTSLIKEHYDEGQRLVLAEVLWRIVYADGRLTDREGALARRLAHLLDLPAGYLAEARKRAVEK